jgi:spore maturation protein CgeB
MCLQAMKLVIFGLTISSSWGNGHATLLRGLFRALARRGHQVVFFERDTSYYAEHRDFLEMKGVRLELYSDWTETERVAQEALSDADVGMVTSYCPDGVAASDLVLSSSAERRVFYDLDTPITFKRMRHGEPLSYIGPRGLRDFDVALSYTGGSALDELRSKLGARQVATLYGSVDPEVHKPVGVTEHYRSDLSYLGTYAEDRQSTLDELFLEPARRRPDLRFMIGGATYPGGFPWGENIYFVRHLPPQEHSAFYCSSRVTLNVTRSAMAEMGYCPSGRLFEAAACGVPILTDEWEGLQQFFEPGREILMARNADDVIEAIRLPTHELSNIARAARERVLAEHTADHRAIELENALWAKPRSSDAAAEGSLVPSARE